MNRFLIFIFLLSFFSCSEAATYCVRADGQITTTGGSPSSSCASATNAMNVSGFNARVSSAAFTSGDVIYFSSRGGNFTSGFPIPMPGGHTEAITIAGEPGYTPTFNGSATGTLFNVTYGTLGVNNKIVINDLITTNWGSSGYAYSVQNANVVFNRITCTTTSGNACVEGFVAGNITINDSHNFGGYATHWVGVHGSINLRMTNCDGIGGAANAVHTIEHVSTTLDRLTVTSPATGGQAAFGLQGDGLNQINNSVVYINKTGYHAILTGGAGSTNYVNNIAVVFGGTADTGSTAFMLGNYEVGKPVVVKGGIVTSKTGHGSGMRLNEGATGSFTATFTGTHFYNIDEYARQNGASGSGAILTFNGVNTFNAGSRTGTGTFNNNNPLSYDPTLLIARGSAASHSITRPLH